MKTKIYVPDIECDSCVKLIDRKLKTLQGIETLTFSPDSLEVVHDSSLVNAENIIHMIKNVGFRASLDPFERKTIKERFRDIKENPHKYALERQGILYTLSSFFILMFLDVFYYYAFDRSATFWSTYGIWLFYLNLSVVSIGMALWHFSAYRGKITCMVGMMIGMIIGMQAGMMLGAVIGATNGFFIGAMTGMMLGSLIGGIAGNCCGIMGVLQGMMAGLMGGTMGPMISLMMFSDHLQVFMPFYMVINILILAGFSYMIIEEVAENKKVERRPTDFLFFASVCVLVAAGLTLLMLHAPKSTFLGV